MEKPRSDVEARLAAQHRLTRELLASDTLEQAAPAYLSSVGTLLDWDAGGLWEIPQYDRMLHFVDGWHGGTVDPQILWAESRKLRMGRGTGLPGRAWESGEIVWVTGLEHERGFPRHDLFAELGLQAALAIPVPVGVPENVLGVAEFYTTDFSPSDEDLLSLLVGFTDQLAMFMRRRRVEHALRESEGLKSAMLGSAYDCVIGMNHLGRVIEFNDAAEETFGYRREETIGQELAELVIPPELRERHRQGLARYLETGESRIMNERIELTAMRRDGSTVPIELAVTRIPGSDPPIFTGYVREITERIEAERIRAHLAAVVQDAQEAVMSKDLNGIVTSWNEGAQRLYGYTPEEAIGQPISILIPADHGPEEWRILDRVRRGERVEPYETERIRKDGVRIDVSLTVSPIKDPILGVTGASIVARDITAEKRRRSAQDFMARAAAALEASLDVDEIARTIVSTAVPDLAELCVIDFLEDDGTIGRATVGAADPQLGTELEVIRREHPIDLEGDHPVARVLQTGRALVMHDLKQPGIQDDLAQSDEHRDFIARADYSSAAIAPMFARGRLVGALSFLHVANDRRFDEDDLTLLEDLAARSAMALDNARLYAERDRIAKVLQRGLRPEEPQPIPGLEVSVVFEAAGEGVELGGDFYDVIPVEGSHYVLVGDVAGHGVEVAAYTAQIRHTVRALARFGTPPGDIVERVNTVLLETDTGQRFATLQLARIETRETGAIEVELASAAHPPAVIVRADGTTETLSGGAIVGVWQRVDVAVHRFAVEPGETLLLYTDGWLEAGPVEVHRTAEELAREIAAVADDDLDSVLDRLRLDAVARAGSELRDDMVLLALRPTGSREPAPTA
ncbi:MAG: PAS domain S-box protein [Solirubrobacterales bacterium]